MPKKRGRKRKIVIGRNGVRYEMHPKHQGKDKIRCCGSDHRPGCRKLKKIEDFYPSQLTFPGVICRECAAAYAKRLAKDIKGEDVEEVAEEHDHPNAETVLDEREMVLLEELNELRRRTFEVQASLRTLSDLREALV